MAFLLTDRWSGSTPKRMLVVMPPTPKGLTVVPPVATPGTPPLPPPARPRAGSPMWRSRRFPPRWRGSRRSRAEWRRLMRWGAAATPSRVRAVVSSGIAAELPLVSVGWRIVASAVWSGDKGQARFRAGRKFRPGGIGSPGFLPFPASGSWSPPGRHRKQSAAYGSTTGCVSPLFPRRTVPDRYPASR